MNKLRIYTKVGIFEILCETEPIEDLHSLVEKAFVDAQATLFSGSAKNGVVAYFPKSVLKDCVIEIIESEEELCKYRIRLKNNELMKLLMV